MKLNFEGRRVVVTGGTGALGSAVVGLLLENGAQCRVSCLHLSELERFPYAKHPRIAISEGIDLADEAAVARLYAPFTAAEALWASLHIAGGFAMNPIDKTSAAEFAQMWQTNAATCFLCSREAVKAIRLAGAAGGRIVNVAAR